MIDEASSLQSSTRQNNTRSIYLGRLNMEQHPWQPVAICILINCEDCSNGFDQYRNSQSLDVKFEYILDSISFDVELPVMF